MAQRKKTQAEIEAAFEVANQALGKMGLELPENVTTTFDPKTGRVSVVKGTLTLKSNIAGSTFCNSCTFFDFLSKHASHTIDHVEDMVQVHQALTGSEEALEAEALIAEHEAKQEFIAQVEAEESAEADEPEPITQRWDNPNHPKDDEVVALLSTQVFPEIPEKFKGGITDELVGDSEADAEIAAALAEVEALSEESPEPEIAPVSSEVREPGSYSGGAYVSSDDIEDEDEEGPKSLDFDNPETSLDDDFWAVEENDNDDLFNNALADQLEGLGLDNLSVRDEIGPDSAVA